MRLFLLGVLVAGAAFSAPDEMSLGKAEGHPVCPPSVQAETRCLIGPVSRRDEVWFLSPKVSDMIMAGDADDPLKTRRREITVVFVDRSGCRRRTVSQRLSAPGPGAQRAAASSTEHKPLTGAPPVAVQT